MTIYEHPYPHVDGHPSLAEIEVTSACNARCVFCPRHLFTHPKRMTRDTFEQLMTRLVEARISHAKLVGIGEPTLHSDLMHMLRRLREHDIRPLLNTNGSKLHRWNLDELLSLCEEVIVSVHSLNHETHTEIFGVDFYDQVMSNLQTLLEANERHQRTITLYVVLTTANRDALKGFERFGSKVRVRVSGCTNRALEGFADQLIDLSAAKRHNHYASITEASPMCGYAEAAIVIDSVGRYLLCTNDVERRTGLGTIWEHSIDQAFQAIRSGLASGSFLWLCKKCENFELYRRNLEERTGPMLGELAGRS